MHHPPEDRPESPYSIRRWMKRKPESGLIARDRLRLFPLGGYLRGYSMKTARADAGAAANVAFLDFPQALAFAAIAGLPLSMGLYGAALASLIAPIFASSRHLMVGPTNAVAILTLSGFASLGLSGNAAVAAMPLLLLMVAAFLVAGALVRVAAITNFVSRSVVTGYITVAAITIVANQIHPFAGLASDRETTPLELIGALLRDLPHTHLPSLAIGLLTALIYVGIRSCTKRIPAVAGSLLAVYLLHQIPWVAQHGVSTLRDAGLSLAPWRFTWPSWDLGLLRLLLPMSLAIAFLSLLESSSIAKAIAARGGERVDVNQQMLSLGVANVGCALGGGMSISGSLTRSRLNQESGARTPVSSIMSGLILIVAIFVIGPHASGIPKPALASVIIIVGISLINRANIRLMLGATRGDAAVFVSTVLVGLFLPLTTAIFAGAALSITLFLKKAALPNMEHYAFTEEGREVVHSSNEPPPAVALLHVEGDLFFGSSDIFLDQARRMCADPSIRVVIIRLRNAHNIDASCAAAFLELLQFSRERARHVLVSGVRPEVQEIFRDSGLLRALGKENFFPDTPENPTLSTSRALRRARDLMGGAHAEVRLFLSSKQK